MRDVAQPRFVRALRATQQDLDDLSAPLRREIVASELHEELHRLGRAAAAAGQGLQQRARRRVHVGSGRRHLEHRSEQAVRTELASVLQKTPHAPRLGNRELLARHRLQVFLRDRDVGRALEEDHALTIAATPTPHTPKVAASRRRVF